jgi:hypothetical protein
LLRKTRRRLDVVWLAAGAIVAGGAVAVGALAGDNERIADYWLHAHLDADGAARVVEVIDYDFGAVPRHGILRDIPGVAADADILVSSPTAPDEFVASGADHVELRIGDPRETVTNRHRYRIEYPIDTVASQSRLGWDAIGTGWDVEVQKAEIHVTASTRFTSAVCHSGSEGAVGGCDVEEVEPGHLLVEVSGLAAGEGVTIEAERSADPSTPILPAVPTGAASDPGTGWLPPAIAASAGAVLAAAAVSRRVREMGREQVWEGGAADAAFGPGAGETIGHRLVDHAELAEMATIEFESPRGLSAAAGGIIHAERVQGRHQIAWLIECAIREEVILDETSGDLRLLRGPVEPHPAVRERLDDIFGSPGGGAGEPVELGEYDPGFSKAWEGLKEDLDEWREASGLWDPIGESRRSLSRVGGAIVALVGAVVAVGGGVLANRSGDWWLAIAAAGGLVAGGGLAALVRAWELPIRTPEGSARWLQIESFRRFIANSEARHAEAAARMGLLRQYTAWAVALDELDHWEEAVEEAAAAPGSTVAASPADWAFAALAHDLSGATTAAVTAPSSSGGGGGGGVGGGGGGGGGGSW